MRTFLSAFAILASAALAAPAAAQNKQDDQDRDEIVVEGSRDRERQIEQFVDALTPARNRGQLSRFEWSVCPAAMGLSEAQNAAVAARMLRVAKAASIPTGEANCRPNVFVVVTREKQAFIEQLRKQYPADFADMAPQEIRSLASSAGPVAAWHVKGLLNADGLEVGKNARTGYYVNQATDMPSRITNTTRPHFVASIVVLELNAVGGLTTKQLADYAAMRAFSQADPSKLTNAAAPTILTMLDAPADAPVPITLTQWDLSFLRGLYSSSDNLYASQQRGEIERAMGKDLEKAQSKE